MSRELMQVDKPSDVLALTGRAMAELAQVDRALLLVRGDVTELVGFDREGRPRKEASSHDW